MNLLYCLLLFFTANLQAEPKMDYELLFDISDPETGKIYFHGKETRYSENQSFWMEAKFFDQKNSLTHEERSRFDRQSLRLENYFFRDNIQGEETHVETVGEQAHLEHRTDIGKKVEKRELRWVPETYSGKVLPDLIVRNWQRLLQGKPLNINLFVPFRTNGVDFEIVFLGLSKRDYGSCARFEGKVRNIFLRLFAPKIVFEFSVEPEPKLRAFSGPSPTPIDGVSSKIVTISLRPIPQ